MTDKRLDNENDNENEHEEVKIKPFQFFEQPITNKALTFYLSNAIVAPEHYVEMIHRIRTAGPNDVVYIILNTPGGQLDTGIQLINAMHTSQAKVITVLEAECHSLGTLIFLAGDEFIVHDNCLMMFHNLSGGVVGKGNEQMAQVEATNKWFRKVCDRIYYPFLSRSEIDRILKGEDIWVDSDEIRDRLHSMAEILAEEQAAEQAAEEKAKKASTKKKTTKKKAKSK